jgi:hypothetical protein
VVNWNTGHGGLAVENLRGICDKKCLKLPPLEFSDSLAVGEENDSIIYHQHAIRHSIGRDDAQI